MKKDTTQRIKRMTNRKKKNKRKNTKNWSNAAKKPTETHTQDTKAQKISMPP